MAKLDPVKTFRMMAGIDVALALFLLVQVGGCLLHGTGVSPSLSPDAKRTSERALAERTESVDDYQPVVERALFGKAPTAPPKPKAKLALRGVIGDKAILCSASTKKTELVGVGEEFEGATVKEIRIDSVTIDRDGETEELKLFVPGSAPPPSPSSPSKPSPSPSPRRPPRMRR